MSRYYEYADGGLCEVDNLVSVDKVLEIIDELEQENIGRDGSEASEA